MRPPIQHTTSGSVSPSLLICVALGLVAGSLGGYLGVSAWRAGSSNGASGSGLTRGSGGDALATGQEQLADGAAPVQADPLNPELSMAAALRAVTAGMSTEERFAEITRMMGDSREVQQADMQRHWISLHLRYQALFRPEDLPRLKELALDQKKQVGILDSSYWPFQSAFIMSWADWDAADLEQWVKEPPSEERGFMPMMGTYCLARKWAQDDPFVAWDKVTRLQEEMSAQGMAGSGLWAVVPQAIKANLQLTFEKCRTLKNPQERKQMLSLVLREVVGTDFSRALEMARTEPEAGLAREMETEVVSSHLYASKDPKRFAKVAEYLLSEEGAQSRSNVLWSLMHYWQKADPAAAEAWADTNKEYLEPYGVLDNLERSELKKKSIEDLMTDASALPVGMERSQAYLAAFQKLQARDPEKALDEVVKLDKDTATNVFRSLGWTYYQSDPAMVAGKLSSLPGEEIQTQAMQQLMESWMEFNPKAASTWLDTQPTGIVKDQGIRRLIQKTSKDDPVAAAQWAVRASNEATQKALLVETAAAWKTKDAQAARRWIWEQNLPHATTEAFLKALD